MEAVEIRQQTKAYIDKLSATKLLVAAEFLADLLEKYEDDATEELLKISGFKEAFTKAQKNAQEGKVISVEKLKRKY